MHYLQSPAWAAFHTALGNKTFIRSGEGWHYLAILDSESSRITRLYCPYGPQAEDEHSLGVALESLMALARSQGVMFARVQPLGTPVTERIMRRHGLVKVDYSQPSLTWQLDLSPSTDELIAAMKQNNRSIYRNYTKKGMSYRRSTNPRDIPTLMKLLRSVEEQNGITFHSDDYFTTQFTTLLEQNAGSLHFIDYEGFPIAAAFVYEGPSTNYYAYAAATYEHRKLNAPTALLAEIIFDAKRQGKQLFDFYGITDSTDSSHRWAGFTRFKKSFGGHQQFLSYTYDMPVKTLQYKSYQIARKLRSLQR